MARREKTRFDIVRQYWHIRLMLRDRIFGNIETFITLSADEQKARMQQFKETLNRDYIKIPYYRAVGYIQ